MKKINIFKINCQKIKILKIKHGATLAQPLNLPRFEISKCKQSSKHWSYHKIAFNSQKAKIWTKVKSFDQFHEN